MTIFDDDDDYEAFERVVEEAVERFDMRLLAYQVMPNHWHQVLWPKKDGDLSRRVNLACPAVPHQRCSSSVSQCRASQQLPQFE
jgi:hypothetical protein